MEHKDNGAATSAGIIAYQRPKLTPAQRKFRAELRRWAKMIESERRYRRRTVPVELPEGQFLVHSDYPFDSCGFEFWVQRGSRALIPCECSFGGRVKLKPSETIKHYKIDNEVLFKDCPVRPPD
jgi:hypothetical protein